MVWAAVAVLVTTATAGLAATIAGAADGSATADQQGGGAAVLESEIGAMRAGGADDGKVAMLEDDLEALEEGRTVDAPAEPGVDMRQVLDGSGGGGARDAGDDARDHATASDLDEGRVQCEVIPPDLLTASDIAGATCTSTPQADGTSLYRAAAPDGTVRTVRFGADGSVRRLPDRRS
jgi:hypothetical protein